MTDIEKRAIGEANNLGAVFVQDSSVAQAIYRLAGAILIASVVLAQRYSAAGEKRDG